MCVEAREPRLPFVAAGSLALAALGFGLWGLSDMPQQEGDRAAVRQQGERLFDGRAPLVARLAGHAHPLPADAARCIQCHGVVLPGGETFAPRLTAEHLRQRLPRRGGPPTAYDVRSFCRVLRDGVDPAQVILPRSMPRFVIDDAQCGALWTYLAGDTPS